MKTKKSFLLSALLGCAVLSITSCSPETKPSETKNENQTAVDTTTRLRIVNNTDSAVTVYITLGTTPGCLQHVSQIPFVTDSIGSLVGSFVLNAHDSTADYAPASIGYNGNISFNTQPLNCPTPQFKTGVNIFEFIVNNSFQPSTPQNTIDISCVAGVNCWIKVSMTGGNTWNAGSIAQVDSFYNKGIANNKGLVGVFPYGCDICTGKSNPPACVTTDTNKQTQPICNVQRNAVGAGGGTIRVEYNGEYKLVPL